MTLDRCQITEYSRLPDGLTRNFFVTSPILGLYNYSEKYSISIYPSCADLGSHLLVWSLHSWWTWNRRRGVTIYQESCCTDTQRPFWTCPWDLPVTMIKLFYRQRANLLVLGLLSSSTGLYWFLNHWTSD